MVVVLQVVSRAATLVAQVQQHIRSEQDTNPVVSDGIQAEFGDKGELLQLAERLGELKLRECERITVHSDNVYLNKAMIC